MLSDMDAAVQNDLASAIEKAGGQSEVARLLGIAQQSVSEWVARGVVPPKRVLEIERLTGVPRHRLRPDIYPPESIS